MIEVVEWFNVEFDDGSKCSVKSVNDYWVLKMINEGKKVIVSKREWRVSFSEIVDSEEELNELMGMLNLVDERGC